uniref:Phospholipid scramblase n=1 Tax=Globodera pallida TaxID=36090 RepID=A0A183BJE4_GLOPA
MDADSGLIIDDLEQEENSENVDPDEDDEAAEPIDTVAQFWRQLGHLLFLSPAVGEEIIARGVLFPCWCAIIFCLALMAEDKNVLAVSNDGVEPRIALYFEGGKLVRVKRACGEDRCGYSRQCDVCCACVGGFCCPTTR